MHLLQTGITGIDVTSNVPIRDFKHAVYTAAVSEHVKVGGVTPADSVTLSYHRIDVDFGSEQLSVLCNRIIPIVAFTDRIKGMKIERFVEAPGNFSAVLKQLGFVIGDVAELNRPVTSADLAALSPAEQHEAKYWKPERVGDIIFNWWD